MNLFLKILVFISIVNSCNHKVLKLTLKPTDPKVNLKEVQREINTRFLKHKLEQPTIHLNEEQHEIVVEISAKMYRDDLDYEELLITSNSLDFWETYQVDDKEIEQILNELPKIVEFTPVLPKYIESSQTVLGYCNNEDRLTEIVIELEQWSQKLSNLKLVWSKEKHQPSFVELKPAFFLHLIDTKGLKTSKINDTDIENIDVQVGVYGMPIIAIELGSRATPIFSNMTEEAASNGNRAIAIVINNRLYSVPRVVAPILGGKLSLNNNSTLQETNDLVRAIRLGRIHEMTILKQEISEK